MVPPPAAIARPPYRPLSGRAAAATAVLGLLLALDVAAVTSGYFEVQLLDRLIAGETVPDPQLEANDTRVGMIGLGQGALWVACAIAFISWLHRAYGNVDALAPPHARYSKGWTIGAWFVPVMNFFRPKHIVNDVWDSGSPRTGAPFWLMLWWIGFLISGLLGRIAFPELGEYATLEQLRTDSINYMVSDGFDVVVPALAILVVRVLTRNQEARADAEKAKAHPLQRDATAAPAAAAPAG